MLGSILIATGVLMAVGSILAGFLIVNLGCAMGSGCEQSGLELIIGLMTSAEGTVLWATLSIAFVIISMGYRVRARAKRDV